MSRFKSKPPFDKMRQVNQPAIVENKHLDAALMLAKQMQAIMPHHRKRNNDAPARRDQSMHIFPEPEPPAKIDRRRLGGSKLKPSSRLSKAELQARGTWEFVKAVDRAHCCRSGSMVRHLHVSASAGSALRCVDGSTQPLLSSTL